MKEKWKILNQCNEYSISNLGNLKRNFESQTNRNRWPKDKILTPTIDSSGYHQIRFKNKRVLVHHLVCEHFIGKRPNRLTVNHKDGNKLNNILDNLEYVTRSYQMIHAYKLGLKKPYKSKRQRELAILNENKS